MTPEQIERLLKALEKLAASSGSDPYRDLKVFFLGLMTAFVAGYFSHWLTVRREEGKRRLELWERLVDWDRDGRKDDLRVTNLSPPWLWRHLWGALWRLGLPIEWLPWRRGPRYLDLIGVNLGADEEHEQGAVLRWASLPWAQLFGANLSMADLMQANLEKADLTNANLKGAMLWRANLRKAHLFGADLRGVNLHDADLRGADMSNAKLQEADLRDANLQGAILWSANLQKANLEYANLQGTDLRDANLKGAKWDDETVWPEGFTPPEDTVKIELPTAQQEGEGQK